MLAERNTIFGDTYDGVPSPYVPHVHPYPTRYHGLVRRVPEAIFSYQPASNIMPGRWHGLSSFEATKKLVARDYKGMGDAGPDGLGSIPALLASATGHPLLDGLAAAAIGYFLAPVGSNKAVWASVAGATGILTGTLGIIGVTGYSLYKRAT